MGLYVIVCVDRPDMLDLRHATRPAHLEFLARASCVKIAGPFLNAAGDMVGSMLVIETSNLEEAYDFAARDPYSQVGLFESSSVRPWKQTAGSSAL